MTLREWQVEEITDQVKQAYADLNDSDYPHQERCLTFLTYEFVEIEFAKELLNFVGSYYDFDGEKVKSGLDGVASFDPESRVAIGREGSVVLYIETEYPGEVAKIFEGGRFPPKSISEIDRMEVGVNDAWRLLDIEPHSECVHLNPPVEEENFALSREGKSVIRTFWI